MGYHIFTARKVSLTTLINNWEENEMKLWCRQVGLANEVDAIYQGFLDSNGTELTTAQEQRIHALQEIEDDLERKIQLCETHIEEFTNELQKVEEYEKTAIDADIPNYSGAGGNK